MPFDDDGTGSSLSGTLPVDEAEQTHAIDAAPVPSEPVVPPANLNAQLWTMGAIVATVVTLLVEIDVFAFLNRAFSTISQVGLHIQVKYLVFVPLLCLVCSIGYGHLSVSHSAGTPRNWRAIIIYAVVYTVLTPIGVVIGSTLLSQSPNQD